MQIVCAKCSHEQTFNAEVNNYKGYVCPSCNAYYKVNFEGRDLQPEFTFVKNLKQLSPSVVSDLNEIIKDNKINYSIISIIERQDAYGYSHFEYVGLSEDDKDIYFGHGDDYYCKLDFVESSEIIIKKPSQINHTKYNYNLEYDESYTIRSAAGFVFEDLNRKSRSKTYIQSVNENKFISEEEIDGENEYYLGVYLQFEYFKNYFQKLKERVLVEEDARLIFIKIFGLALVGLISIFLLANINNLTKQKKSFYETFTSDKSTTQFVGSSFNLTGTTKMLVFEGISETNNPELNLWIKLVNEQTNEVRESKLLTHYNNDVNFASGVSVEFCRIPAGNYHFVFETSSNVEQALDYKMDYRFVHGKINYFPLIVSLILLVLIGIILYDQLFTKYGDKFYSNIISVNYQTVLKQHNLGYVLAGLLLCFTAYLLHTNYVKECTTSTSLNTLEDHTYTGSRTHYYRSYSADGSGHK